MRRSEARGTGDGDMAMYSVPTNAGAPVDMHRRRLAAVTQPRPRGLADPIHSRASQHYLLNNPSICPPICSRPCSM